MERLLEGNILQVTLVERIKPLSKPPRKINRERSSCRNPYDSTKLDHYLILLATLPTPFLLYRLILVLANLS